MNLDDNRNNRFEVTETATTNVVEGQLKFADYAIGFGYRIGKKNIKAFALLDITVKLTTLYRSKLTTLLSGEKVFKLSGEE